MQKLLFIIVFIFHFQNLLLAQNSGISVELHYPLTMPAEKNNYSDVNGVFGMGFQFQFTDNEVLNYGIEYKFDMNQTYQRYDYGSSQTDSFNFMMNHLNVFSKTNLNRAQNIKFYTDAGFTFYKYKEGQGQQGFTGFNVGAGLNYEFIEKFYFQATYHYINTGIKQQQTDFIDKENFNLFRIGIGFKI